MIGNIDPSLFAAITQYLRPADMESQIRKDIESQAAAAAARRGFTTSDPAGQMLQSEMLQPALQNYRMQLLGMIPQFLGMQQAEEQSKWAREDRAAELAARAREQAFREKQLALAERDMNSSGRAVLNAPGGAQSAPQRGDYGPRAGGGGGGGAPGGLPGFGSGLPEGFGTPFFQRQADRRVGETSWQYDARKKREAQPRDQVDDMYNPTTAPQAPMTDPRGPQAPSGITPGLNPSGPSRTAPLTPRGSSASPLNAGNWGAPPGYQSGGFFKRK